MKIERRTANFRPIVITLEHQDEVDQMIGILNAAKTWRSQNDALAWAIERQLRAELTGVVRP